MDDHDDERARTPRRQGKDDCYWRQITHMPVEIFRLRDDHGCLVDGGWGVVGMKGDTAVFGYIIDAVTNGTDLVPGCLISGIDVGVGVGRVVDEWRDDMCEELSVAVEDRRSN